MSECMSVMKRSGRPSLSKSKNLIPIAPQGVLGKYSAVLSTNVVPALVLEVVPVSLHVQHEKIGPAVAVQIGHARIAAPAGRPQSDVSGHVLEAIVSGVPVEDGILEAVRMRVAQKRVRQADVRAVRPFLVGGVLADIADQKIDQAVAVEVEEHRAGGMRHQIDARLFADVLEVSVSVVLEQHIAAAYRGDEQILIAVVVDVGERGGDADSAGQPDARLLRDVPEPASAQILPQLVAADLVDEVDVVQTVAVDVRHGDAVAVIVVDRLVVLARVVDDVVNEGDAAFLDPVGELELVEDSELVRGRHLRLLARRRAHPRRRRDSERGPPAQLPVRPTAGPPHPLTRAAPEREQRAEASWIVCGEACAMIGRRGVYGFAAVAGAAGGRMTPVPCSIAIAVPNGRDSRCRRSRIVRATSGAASRGTPRSAPRAV